MCVCFVVYVFCHYTAEGGEPRGLGRGADAALYDDDNGVRLCSIHFFITEILLRIL